MTVLTTISEPIYGVLLFGSSGFIGSRFLLALQKSSVPVILLNSRANEAEVLSTLHSAVEDSIEISKYICVSFAAAGASGGSFSKNDYLFNSRKIVDLFEVVRTFGVDKFISFGSCFEYGLSGNSIEFLKVGSPTNPAEQYGKSKLEGFRNLSHWATSNKAHLLYLRLFQVYGQGEVPERLFPSLMRAIERGSDFVVMQPDLVRDFLHVDRVVEEIFLRINSLNNVDYVIVENVCSGKPSSLWSFAEAIWAMHSAHGKLLKAKEPAKALYQRLVGATELCY